MKLQNGFLIQRLAPCNLQPNTLVRIAGARGLPGPCRDTWESLRPVGLAIVRLPCTTRKNALPNLGSNLDIQCL